MHHVAIDGSSSTHFLHKWVAAACTLFDAPPSLMSLLPDAFFQATSTTDQLEVVEMPAGQLLATLTLSMDDV